MVERDDAREDEREEEHAECECESQVCDLREPAIEDYENERCEENTSERAIGLPDDEFLDRSHSESRGGR